LRISYRGLPARRDERGHLVERRHEVGAAVAGDDNRPARVAHTRSALERRGHRFVSNCDSELIAVYLADRMAQGATLKDAMTGSIEELDGVFTYLVATSDSLGMAKDVMAAKPMVLCETDRFIALASEEVAIRSVLPHEIDTFDPYEGEVRVWKS